jgi:hypothetical protein
MTDLSSKDDIRQQIFSSTETFVPTQIAWRDRLLLIWQKTRRLIVILTVFVAGVATFLTNIEKIQQYIGTFSTTPIAPAIVVEIKNSSFEPVDVVKRGDFFLWLPGPEARYTFGKYEFCKLDGMPLDSETFTVAPNAKVRLLARIQNQDLYSKILQQGDCDIALMVRRAIGGHQTADNMPFTKDAIQKYFTTVDIGVK